MTSDNTKRRLPKVLSDELNEALMAVEKLGDESAMDLLERFRRNRAKYISTWGVNNIGNAVSDLEEIPIEHFHAIVNLDKAFTKLHRYRNGGAGDYVAAEVNSEINRLRARKPRNRLNSDEDIAQYLKQRGYETSDNLKELVMDATSHFDTSESTVRRAISSQGLTKRKKRKSTVT